MEKHTVSPVCHDYPFRHWGARGPGTGGMGRFTNAETGLQFMSESDLADCRAHNAEDH